jgi:hypothetical protein
VLAAPIASRVNKTNTRVSHHRFAETSRHSLRNGLNGFLRALPGDRALLPPSPSGCLSAKLDTSVGASGPHDFAVRDRQRSSHAPARPSHPAPNVRDDRETPLLREQDAGISGVDLPDGTSGIFFALGLDDPNHVESLREIAVLAQRFCGPRGSCKPAIFRKIELICPCRTKSAVNRSVRSSTCCLFRTESWKWPEVSNDAKA